MGDRVIRQRRYHWTPDIGVDGEGGEPEMVGPVSFMTKALQGALNATHSAQDDNTAVLFELRALRNELELLPILLRDAMNTVSQ